MQGTKNVLCSNMPANLDVMLEAKKRGGIEQQQQQPTLICTVNPELTTT
jgi:hypothetical protein